MPNFRQQDVALHGIFSWHEGAVEADVLLFNPSNAEKKGKKEEEKKHASGTMNSSSLFKGLRASSQPVSFWGLIIF